MAPVFPTSRYIGDSSAWVTRVLGWLCVSVPAWAVLTDAGTGIDAMDESHYLLAALPTSSGDAFNSIFGWYTGVLWWLCGHDLARLRILGALILLAAAMVLAASGRALIRARVDLPSWLSALWWPCTAAAALSYYTVFVRTPSYNWLAAVGLMLMVAATLRLLAKPAAHNAVGWGAMVGVAAFVTATGKVTTALAAVIVVMLAASVQAWQTRSLGVVRRAAAGAAIGGLLAVLAHGLLIQPLGATVATLRRTSAMMAAVDPHAYGGGAREAIVAGLINLVWDRPLDWIPALLALGGLALLVVVLHSQGRMAAKTAGAVLAGGFVLVMGPATAVTMARYPGGVPGLGMSSVPFVVLAQSALIVCMAAAALRRHRDSDHTAATANFGPRESSTRAEPGVSPVVAPLAAVAMALCYPIGTNVEYATQLHGAFAILFVASGIALATLPTVSARAALSASAVAVLVMGVILVPLTRERAPYRIAPLAQHREPVSLVDGAAPVLVDADTSAWIGGLRRAASEHGWRAGMPMLDLTWHPLSVVVMQARPPSVLLPALPGWPDPGGSAAFAVRQEDPEVWRGAWLLVPLGQPDSVTDQATRELGLEFPADYDQVATVTAPYDGQVQGLWRPRT